jgi:hypothetical protein
MVFSEYRLSGTGSINPRSLEDCLFSVTDMLVLVQYPKIAGHTKNSGTALE